MQRKANARHARWIDPSVLRKHCLLHTFGITLVVSCYFISRERSQVSEYIHDSALFVSNLTSLVQINGTAHPFGNFTFGNFSSLGNFSTFRNFTFGNLPTFGNFTFGHGATPSNSNNATSKSAPIANSTTNPPNATESNATNLVEGSVNTTSSLAGNLTTTAANKTKEGVERDDDDSRVSSQEEKSFSLEEPATEDRYHISCGRSGAFVAVACIGNLPIVNRYVGDRDTLGIVMYGETVGSLYPKKLCAPFCGSERSGKQFILQLPLKTGKYSATFSLAESSVNQTGSRIVNITILSAAKNLDDLDIFANVKSKKKMFFSPYVDFDADSQKMFMHFTGRKGDALCNTIDIIPASEAVQLASARAPLSDFFFCSNKDKENVRVESPSKENLPVSLLGNLPGNFNMYRATLKGSGEHKVFETEDSNSKEVFSRYLQSPDCICPRGQAALQRQFSCPSQYSEVLSTVFQKWKSSKVQENDFNSTAFKDINRCAIVKQKLYCNSVANPSPARVAFLNLVLAVLRAGGLQDVEFYFYSTEQPAVEHSQGMPPAFGPFYTEKSPYVPVPSWDMIQAAFSGQLFVNAANTKPWEKRRNSSFTVLDSSEKLSEQEATALEAMKISGLVSVSEVLKEPESSPEVVRKVSDHKMFLAGANSSWITPYTALSSATVLVRANTPRKEWFDLLLKPGETYLEHTKGSLLDFFQEALANDTRLFNVSQNGQLFAFEKFNAGSLICWMAAAFGEQTSILAFPAKARDGFQEVAQPADSCKQC